MHDNTRDAKLQAERNARHIAAGRPIIDPMLINREAMKESRKGKGYRHNLTALDNAGACPTCGKCYTCGR